MYDKQKYSSKIGHYSNINMRGIKQGRNKMILDTY